MKLSFSPLNTLIPCTLANCQRLRIISSARPDGRHRRGRHRVQIADEEGHPCLREMPSAVHGFSIKDE